MSEPQGFHVGERVTLEDVGIEMPPPPPELVLEWSREPLPEWTVTIGEGKP
jgi:hypothetical protein